MKELIIRDRSQRLLGNASDVLRHLKGGEPGLLNDLSKNIRGCSSNPLLKLSGKGYSECTGTKS